MIAVVSWPQKAMFQPNGDFLPHVRLAKDLMVSETEKKEHSLHDYIALQDPRRYDNRIRPVLNHSRPTRIVFSMSLYQILAINEKVQSVDLNLWVIQKWNDEFLGWHPGKYGGINTTIPSLQPNMVAGHVIVMNREETERYINAVVSTNYWKQKRGALVMFMYPALYRSSCRIHIRYFPYDLQNCTLVISSWTSDQGSIDYVPEYDSVNLGELHSERGEKFLCCPNPWILLEASLVVPAKTPVFLLPSTHYLHYYIVNLIVPTSVITLVAVTGFFTPASTSNERREKLSLGKKNIDSLLAMSILLTMISEQMPTISDYVPLFGIYYLAIIGLIFVGTLFLCKTRNRPIPPLVSFLFFHKVAPWLGVRPPTSLLELWIETGVRVRGMEDVRGVPRFRQSAKRKQPAGPPKRPTSEKPNYRSNGGNDERATTLLNADHRSTTPSSAPSSAKEPPTVALSYTSPHSPRTSMKAKDNWRKLAAKASARRPSGRRWPIGSKTFPFADGASLAPSTSLAYDPPGTQPPTSRLPKLSTASRLPLAGFANLLPSLQLLYTQGEGGANEAFLLEAKLRRRYAHEWEFLAAVLDRVLLIVFSVLVLLVTAGMIAVGEAIHFSYTLIEDHPQDVSQWNLDNDE
ncbi:hypothetical protein M3Y99_01454700 [Aphelenchoides fujianensis]|nr:hypothetical protein M3Y99_01454700 [Aphelenchoides fujianensis]